MEKPTSNPAQHEGFTLIELSIVLVIIGLLVGGVLAGKALIEQAATRAAASRLQQLETAYRTIQAKYNCTIGDCSNATDYFGMNYIVVPSGCPPSGGAGNGNGNGDGFIDKSSGSTGDGSWKCEPKQAARSLQLANLLPTAVTSPCVSSDDYFKGINDSCAYFYNDDLYGAVSNVKVNNITWTKRSQNGFWLNAAALSPVQARSIDEKLDDGIANKGKFKGLDAADGITFPLISGSCSIAGVYNHNEDFTCRSLYYMK